MQNINHARGCSEAGSLQAFTILGIAPNESAIIAAVKAITGALNPFQIKMEIPASTKQLLSSLVQPLSPYLKERMATSVGLIAPAHIAQTVSFAPESFDVKSRIHPRIAQIIQLDLLGRVSFFRIETMYGMMLIAITAPEVIPAIVLNVCTETPFVDCDWNYLLSIL